MQCTGSRPGFSRFLALSLTVIVIVFNTQLVKASEQTDRLMSTPEKITGLLQRKQITPAQVPNPHWNAKGCAACHNGKPSKRNLKLRTENIAVMCGNCHKKLSHESYFHPTEIKPSKAKARRMPKKFKKILANRKLSKGKINCITCHDVVKQCYISGFTEKGDNHEFFRGGPYTTRTALCFNCHNREKYKRFNPHKQVSGTGKVYKKSCLICHRDSKYLFKKASLDKYEFNVGKDWKKMCTGCHPWKPHPGGELAFGKKVPNHLVKPSDYILKTMTVMSKKKNVYLPLEPHTGKLYCGTCHNAHSAGVMRTAAKKKGSNRKFRLRAKKMCDYCHDLY